MSNTEPQRQPVRRNHLSSVPAGPAFAAEHDRKVAAAQRREDRRFWASLGAASLVTAVTLVALVSGLSDKQAPPAPEKVMAPTLLTDTETVVAGSGDSYSSLAAEAGVPSGQIPAVAEQLQDQYGNVLYPQMSVVVPVPKGTDAQPPQG